MLGWEGRLNTLMEASEFALMFEEWTLQAGKGGSGAERGERM